MNALKQQIQKLDADIVMTPELQKISDDLDKRVEAFNKLEPPAMMIKRSIERVVGSLHNRSSKDYSGAVESVLYAIPFIEKYIADLKKRINEFKRIPEVTYEDYQKQLSKNTRR